MTKYKVIRGYNAPSPSDHKPMPYEVYKKKRFGPWVHVETFDTSDEAQKYINTCQELKQKSPG